MKFQVHGYLIPLQYIVTTIHFMVSMGREKAYIFLGEVIGYTWQKYILTIAFDELMKTFYDYYDPIYFGHIFNRNITLYVIYEVIPERFQPI